MPVKRNEKKYKPLRKLPCLVCNKTPTDVAHVQGWEMEYVFGRFVMTHPKLLKESA